MRILHTADLHIGKVVNEFSMLEDQKYILKQILEIAKKREVDAVIIAGDVYDRSIPPAEAVTLLDWFLNSLIQNKIQVFMISGNHDSPERVGFVSNILDSNGLYIAGDSNGVAKKVTLQDSFGPIHFYLLPFMKPQIVKYYLSRGRSDIEADSKAKAKNEVAEVIEAEIEAIEIKATENKADLEATEIIATEIKTTEIIATDTTEIKKSELTTDLETKSKVTEIKSEEIKLDIETKIVVDIEAEIKTEDNIRTFEDGVKASLKEIQLNEQERNILITHHFVTNCGVEPEQSESEVSLSLGGVDNVEASVFDDFDYVALGHIHRPQMVKRESIRYAGSPLKYSFSEVLHTKSITLIDVNEKGNINIEQVELKPLKDMRKIKGSIKELMDPNNYGQANTMDYIQAILTDEMELVDPIGTLRSVYPNVMQIILEKNLSESKGDQKNYVERKNKSTIELFDEFYTNVTSREFDEERKQIMLEIMEEVVGGSLA